MGAEEEGSDWTGARDAECHDDCGWYDDHEDIEGCIVAPELIGDVLQQSERSEIPDREWVACPHESECKWQQQLGDETPCPPRLAIMLNLNPEVCLF